MSQERTEQVIDRADRISVLLRKVKRLAKKGQQVPQSALDEMNELLASLSRHVRMHNSEIDLS